MNRQKISLALATTAFALFSVSNSFQAANPNSLVEVKGDVEAGASIYRRLSTGELQRITGPATNLSFSQRDLLIAKAGGIVLNDVSGVFNARLNPRSEAIVVAEDHGSYVGVYYDLLSGKLSVTRDESARATNASPIRKLRVRKGAVMAGASGSGYEVEVLDQDRLKITCTSGSAKAWNKANGTEATLAAGTSGTFGPEDDFSKVEVK